MLSLSMIVRDEAERIESCLNSVKGFVDEMVLLDTGSTDNTVALAEAAGAQVERLDWPGDFAPARNAALEHVRGDWVLVLDADERLRAEAIPAIRALMAQPDVLVINLLRHELGAAMAPYSNVSRLFRRDARICWSRPYHSMIDDSVAEILQQEPHWRVANCAEPALLHDGYRPDLLNRRDKAERLRQSMEQWLEDQPGDPYACTKLGALEVSSGNHERGVNLLRQGLEQLPDGAGRTAERYELLLNLGIALAPEDAVAAEGFYRQALDLPLDVRLSLGARLNLAALLMQANQLDEAIQLTTTACQRAPEVALAWYNLGLMERRRGDLAASLRAYERSLELNPDHAESHQNFAVARLIGGDIDGARASFRAAIDKLHQQNRAEEAGALQAQVSGIVKLDGSAS
ncbi:TPR domain-containing glycosyltransferase [Synechococcus sp. CS-197]|uniref:TPR domain-containing glycosyltransferase n=1 Tax=Synechococcus sp. CS-197 TaxID=2847985 RepID=UPI000152511F|nr:TPR domain-containing glycosyltransferase [Synechococcus sp. CS-197]MCT0250710.1 glycosyltransferase [Synechococcus sp. CS-197]CAK24646.1 Glycosyltransferase of family GT2; modular; contains a TPR-repeat domain [Synechococcus sp. WH 7803]